VNFGQRADAKGSEHGSKIPYRDDNGRIAQRIIRLQLSEDVGNRWCAYQNSKVAEVLKLAIQIVYRERSK